MLKKEIYPKTKRINCSAVLIEITEKLDGSNLCIFKKEDNLYIAQRNNIFTYDELEENKDKIYKGLYQWLKDNKEQLNVIRNNAVICGEWLGMGKIKYTVDEFDKDSTCLLRQILMMNLIYITFITVMTYLYILMKIYKFLIVLE